MKKLFTVGTLAATATLLAACAGGGGDSMMSASSDPSTNNRLQLNEGMSVGEVQAIVGDFQTREAQGNGYSCYGIVFDELSASGPKALNITFKDGKMVAQDVAAMPCGNPV